MLTGVSVGPAFLRRLKGSCFTEVKSGEARVYDVGQCEVCGEEVEEANTVTLLGPVDRLRKAGLIERPLPLQEVCIIDNDSGLTGCTACDKVPTDDLLQAFGG